MRSALIFYIMKTSYPSCRIVLRYKSINVCVCNVLRVYLALMYTFMYRIAYDTM